MAVARYLFQHTRGQQKKCSRRTGLFVDTQHTGPMRLEPLGLVHHATSTRNPLAGQFLPAGNPKVAHAALPSRETSLAHPVECSHGEPAAFVSAYMGHGSVGWQNDTGHGLQASTGPKACTLAASPRTLLAPRNRVASGGDACSTWLCISRHCLGILKATTRRTRSHTNTLHLKLLRELERDSTAAVFACNMGKGKRRSTPFECEWPEADMVHQHVSTRQAPSYGTPHVHPPEYHPLDTAHRCSPTRSSPTGRQQVWEVGTRRPWHGGHHCPTRSPKSDRLQQHPRPQARRPPNPRALPLDQRL